LAYYSPSENPCQTKSPFPSDRSDRSDASDRLTAGWHSHPGRATTRVAHIPTTMDDRGWTMDAASPCFHRGKPVPAKAGRTRPSSIGALSLTSLMPQKELNPRSDCAPLRWRARTDRAADAAYVNSIEIRRIEHGRPTQRTATAEEAGQGPQARRAPKPAVSKPAAPMGGCGCRTPAAKPADPQTGQQ
jgi:hypothetical protein